MPPDPHLVRAWRLNQREAENARRKESESGRWQGISLSFRAGRVDRLVVLRVFPELTNHVVIQPPFTRRTLKPWQKAYLWLQPVAYIAIAALNYDLKSLFLFPPLTALCLTTALTTAWTPILSMISLLCGVFGLVIQGILSTDVGKHKIVSIMSGITHGFILGYSSGVLYIFWTTHGNKRTTATAITSILSGLTNFLSFMSALLSITEPSENATFFTSNTFGWMTAVIGILCNWQELVILFFFLKRVIGSGVWRLVLLYKFGRRGGVAIADMVWLWLDRNRREHAYDVYGMESDVGMDDMHMV
jgi:hypothetical protein